MTSISRRNFVGAAAMGLAGTAAAAVASNPARNAWAEAAPVKAADIEFDDEYDVVVLGLGGAGANAAVAAYEEGARVLVCEKAPAGQEPCNTKASGQCVMATDDPDQLYDYLSQLMGKFQNWDEEALRAFCEGCAENFDWMCGPMGGDPDTVYPVENPADRFPEEAEIYYDWALYTDHWGNWYDVDSFWGIDRPGWIYRWHEFPEIPSSQHCLILMTSGTRFDSAYYYLCRDAVDARDDGERMTVWRGCPGKRLIVDDEGAVCGAVVEKDGALLNVKANGGVVLATGGYEADPDMMAGFTQLPEVHLQAGTTNTGDGVRMAAQVGAELWHMSNASGFMWCYQNPKLSTATSLAFGFAPQGVYAGLNGARFMNESAPNRHGRINIGGRWIMTPMPMPTYYIMDASHIGEQMIPSFSADNAAELESGQIIQGATIEELSEQIRALGKAPDFNANGELDESLGRYNAHCHANNGEGEKDDFGRMCTVPVEEGPFYAVEIGATMYNTQGGPRRNGLAQVIAWDGLPVEGLFSAGELGSIFSDMYNGGGNLGETMVFGRIAGRNAAHRAQGTFEGATEPALTHSQKLALVAAQAEEAEKVSLADLALADGTYQGTGDGFGGPLTIEVTVTDGAIAGVTVVSDAETPTIGGQALPVYCDAIVELGDLDAIDVASGASNTLRGFKEAILDAAARASA